MDNSAITNSETVKSQWTLSKDSLALLSHDIHATYDKTWQEFRKRNGHSVFVTASRLLEYAVKQSAKKPPTDDVNSLYAYIAGILNADYILFKLYDNNNGLEYHPLLAYWVSVLEQCQAVVVAPAQESQDVPDWWLSACQARLDIAKSALDVQQSMSAQSPLQALSRERTDYETLDVNKYLRLIQDMGLALPMSSFTSRTDDAHDDGVEHSASNKLKDNNTVQSVESVQLPPYTIKPSEEFQDGQLSASDKQLLQWREYFVLQPGEAVSLLIRLPPDLANLDLMTRILSDNELRQTLQDVYHVKSEDLVRQHLQHSLLYLERAQNSDGSITASSLDGSTNHDSTGNTKADVQRMATLLTIYLRNLLPRGFTPVDNIYLDITELCTRYIWVSAVREFKAWFENAVNGATALVGEELLDDSSSSRLSVGG